MNTIAQGMEGRNTNFYKLFQEIEERIFSSLFYEVCIVLILKHYHKTELETNITHECKSKSS